MDGKRALRLNQVERQVMDVIYRCEPASADDVRDGLPDPPSYPELKEVLDELVQGRLLEVEHTGTKYLYRPTLPRPIKRQTAIKNLLSTFFDGSVVEAVATLIDVSRDRLSPEELDRLAALIDTAREEA